MVISPRIAAPMSLDTIPFIFGIEHEGNLRAELLLSSPADSVTKFSGHQADFALVPSSVVPLLTDTVLITDYCIASSGASHIAVLLTNDPIAKVRRVFADPQAVTALQLAGYLMTHVWGIKPDYFTLDDFDQLNHPQPGDAFVLAGVDAFEFESLFAHTYDLDEEWEHATQLPFVYEVWVAHKGYNPDLVEGLQYALTYGLEHTYEAVVEYDFDRISYDAYGFLSERVDFIFNDQKHKALHKFWDAGIKITPRVNPG